MAGSLVGISLPGFWLGMVLIFIFAVKLQLLPSSGRGPTVVVGGMRLSFMSWEGFRHLILPSITLSIGTLAIDPSNTSVLYVGTGEDVGGRHVGYGDGVYRSRDGGANWENIGLKSSEHIARILVHPKAPDTLFVAAQGPLWNQGGERGFYRTEDGGKTWQRTLGDDAWTGVTDIVMDPRNPDRIYAATWQRHRTVAAYMGGGPNSGLHRSEDGGKTWTKLAQGLPEGSMGKIGLAISPHDPDTVYAAIELDRRKGGIWRSTDRTRGSGWSWASTPTCDPSRMR